MRVLAALLVLAFGARAQDLAVELRLAADPARRGPPAWTWVRAELLPELAAWPPERDPFAACSLVWRGASIACTSGAPASVRAYAETGVAHGGRGLLRGECGWGGDEVWHLADSLAGMPPHAGSFVRLLALDLPGAQELDVAVLAAQLATLSPHDGGPLALLLTRGAVECGAVRFVVDAPSASVRGQSDGGLSLPAAIVLLASLGGDPDRLRHEPVLGERERWRLLAFAGRSDARLEAAAQLGRLGDAQAIEVLTRLLWADDVARAGAMDGLIRAGAAATLPALVDAAHAELATTPALAEAALVNLWDGAGESERSRAAARAAASRFAGIRGRLEVRPGAQAAAGGAGRGLLLGLLAAASIAALGGHEWLRRRA